MISRDDIVKLGQVLNRAQKAEAELEAARARIAELEAQRRNWLDNDITARTLVAQEREIERLLAQGLSQEDREACLIGANVLDGRCSDEARKGCWDERAHALWQRCAAILRRLGGQTT
jgi:multidrug resistance efflux pump